MLKLGRTGTLSVDYSKYYQGHNIYFQFEMKNYTSIKKKSKLRMEEKC